MPRALQRLLFADPPTVRFPTDGRLVPGGFVILALTSDLVLRRRLTIPRRAKRHLAGAVQLLVETETPFSSDEILLHAEQSKHVQANDEIAYDVRMVPRATVIDAIAQLGITPHHVVRITEDGASERLDFWPLVFPVRRLLRWLPLMPLFILFASAGALVFQVSGEQRTRIAALEAATVARLAELRSLTGQIDALRGNMAGELSVSQVLESSPSAFVAMQQVRQRLPEDATLLRLQLQRGELRLALKGPDLLATSQMLAAPATSPPWTSEIDGPITVDAASGLEQATILLSLTQRGSEK
jgi:hypothetical protein